MPASLWVSKIMTPRIPAASVRITVSVIRSASSITRFQIVIGGKVSTGENATNDAESFIDNISLEYRLDRTGTRYVRLFYDKNYESVLEGEITETGVGLVLRKKLDKLSELFIFKKKK